MPQILRVVGPNADDPAATAVPQSVIDLSSHASHQPLTAQSTAAPHMQMDCQESAMQSPVAAHMLTGTTSHVLRLCKCSIGKPMVGKGLIPS